MDSIDRLRERLEALEHQTEAFIRQTRTAERRARWWRGIACGVVLLSLLSWALQSGRAVDAQQGGLPERVEALEDKLAAVTFDAATNVLTLTGANLRIINGLNATDTTNGLGNLIVGYNELRGNATDNRTGSHNVVVGERLSFSSFGGLVVGVDNTISGTFASVTGGSSNLATGESSSVIGGTSNQAAGPISLVGGGFLNGAIGSGSSVTGGSFNAATGSNSSVSGGNNNTASGENSPVSGGRFRSAPAQFNWAAGGLFQAN